MPDLKTYSLSKICGLFDEAIRTIPGYASYDPTYEPRALIDYEKTKDNFALCINPCMRHKKGEKNKSRKIEALIKEKTGKTPRKDAVACSIILTMPEGYEGDVRLFFEAGMKALCITCGIKEEDILYACVHMDESQPHLHFAFLPMAYVRNYDEKLSEHNQRRDEAKATGTKVPARPTILKGECNRKIGEDEKPISSNCGRFGKGFLHTLNKVLEERMAEQGVECKIANGAGSKFDPQKLNHAQREESLKLHKENEKLKKEIEVAKKDKAEAISQRDTAQAEASACKEEVASGVKLATFERTDQKVGFAKKQIMKAAEATGQAEAFEDERTMTYALFDWFNKEKYASVLERKNEVEASLFMKNPLRAERALEYALEKVEEMEEVELG